MTESDAFQMKVECERVRLRVAYNGPPFGTFVRGFRLFRGFHIFSDQRVFGAILMQIFTRKFHSKREYYMYRPKRKYDDLFSPTLWEVAQAKRISQHTYKMETHPIHSGQDLRD